MSNYRLELMKRLYKKSALFDVVNKAIENKEKLEPLGVNTDKLSERFRDKFAKMPQGPAREELIYQEAIKMGPPKNLVPITVQLPDGSKLTYYVMSDYLTLDGIRVPLTGQTAQRIANHFGMYLPTTKMSKQIWTAADGKIQPAPLSAGGVIGGKNYTGEQVVATKIGDSDTSVAYNQRVEEELKKQHGNTPPKLIAGHMKDIVQPTRDGKLSLYGYYDKNGKPIQHSPFTPHDTTGHTEYLSSARLVGGTVKYNGQTMNFEEAMKNPEIAKAISVTPGITKYKVKNEK